MNRVIKKAVSFITAMAVSTSLLASTSISATAAVSAKQTLNNKFEMAIGFANGAFFASDIETESVEYTTEWGDVRTDDFVRPAEDAKFYMITSSGEKITIKNSIGFDKIYSITTGGSPFEIDAEYDYKLDCTKQSSYVENDRSAVIVGKDDKYAVILANGNYLAKGKFFEYVNVGTQYITAISGKYTYFYNVSTGKQVTKIKSTTVGTCSEYDKTSKTFITFSNTTVKDGWGYDYKLVKDGKVIKTFKSDKYSKVYFTKSGNKNIVCAVTNTWPSQYDYYTTAGKKTTLKQSGTSNYNNLSVTEISNWETREYGFTVTDTKGKVILERKGSEYFSKYGDKGEEPMIAYSNGKLFITYDKLYVLDDATGKIEVETKAKGYFGISSISKNNMILYKRELNEDGSYSYYGKNILVSSKGKELSKAFDRITMTSSDKKAKFIIRNDNDKYGFMSSTGKVLVAPKYDDIVECNNNVALVKKSDDTYCLVSLDKCKEIIKNINKEYSSSLVTLSDKKSFLITSNSEKTKYGCIMIKN